MQTIQVVLEEKLLRDADRAARRVRVNRSALIREALREHLKRAAPGSWNSATARAT